MILPETPSLLAKADFKISPKPSKTYAVHFDRNRISGYLDGKSALEQTIQLILSTERFSCPIFSPDYGVEFNTLYGKPFAVILSQLESEIKAALLVDDRIAAVRDFSYDSQGDALLVKFTVVSDFGDIKTGTEVRI